MLRAPSNMPRGQSLHRNCTRRSGRGPAVDRLHCAVPLCGASASLAKLHQRPPLNSYIVFMDYCFPAIEP